MILASLRTQALPEVRMPQNALVGRTGFRQRNQTRREMKKAGTLDTTGFPGLPWTYSDHRLVERRGIEPLTSTMRTWRSPS